MEEDSLHFLLDNVWELFIHGAVDKRLHDVSGNPLFSLPSLCCRCLVLERSLCIYDLHADLSKTDRNQKKKKKGV